MFNLGDLVKVVENCHLKFFVGRMGIVDSRLGKDQTMMNEDGYSYDFDDDSGSCYYFGVALLDGHSHIFSDRELEIISKGKKENV